jgi:hypothetical protein
MMGLTDRVQPWARRFQRAPRETDAPGTEPAGRAASATEREPAGAPGTDPGDRAAPGSQPRTGRFARGVPQER